MSALTDPGAFGLDIMVEAQRGMTAAEATRFLRTGELPDLSQPPAEPEAPEPAALTEDEALRFLAGEPLVAAAGFSVPSSLHYELPNSEDDRSNESEQTGTDCGCTASSETPERASTVVEPTAKTDVNVTAAAEVHTGAMIALVPREEDAARLAVDGGEDADQLHVTLGYLGEAALLPDELKSALIGCVVRCVADKPTVAAEVTAVAMFNPPDLTAGGGDACAVLLVAGQQLPHLHDYIMNDVAQTFGAFGMELHPQHKPWVAHLTLLYTDDADLSYFTDRTGPVTFDRVRLAFGGDVYDVPLGGDGDNTRANDTMMEPGAPEESGS